jgi:UbiA prenyltransferase family
MGKGAAFIMKPAVVFRLGRVSNLPTVWSNILAGTVIAGGEPWRVSTLLAAAGISLLYIAGMYLNDAFDRDIDAKERPERPIPSQLVSAGAVFFGGFSFMLAGLGFVLWASTASSAPGRWQPMFAGIFLAGAILFYDWNHKGNPLSPFFMGLCRVLAYVTAGYVAVAAPALELFLIAAVSFCYLVGLTYAAKQEALDRLGAIWPLLFLAAPLVYGLTAVREGYGTILLAVGAFAALISAAFYLLRRRMKGDVPRAIVSLIAGISLVDALYLAAAASGIAAAIALICFAATLAMQRWVTGT